VIYFLPVGGLMIVALYRGCRNTSDKGTNAVVASIQESADIPFKMAPLIFISTTITQLVGGSAGREGAALQLGGSIAKRLGKLYNLNGDNQRTIVMCGMSAAFSALFGTPLAAAVFSMEVVSVGIMHYAALVPCVISSLTANLVAQFFQVPPEVFPVTQIPQVTALNLLKLLAFGAVVGGVSSLFCVVLHKAEHLYEKYIKNQYLRIAVAGFLLIGMTLALGTQEYLGSGMGIIEHIFHEGETHWYTFLLKMLFTAVTLGAGFKGGEIVPSFTIGAALGCAVATILGLPAELVAACGMVGLFCGVTNSPITSLLIAFELFGFAGMPYYLITIAVSYMVSGHHSLYHKQKIVFSKTKTNYVANE
jgi:H+/Cl- antiporter ClcA